MPKPTSSVVITSVVIDAPAQPQIAKLENRIRSAVLRKIASLQDDPYPPGSGKLHGVFGRDGGPLYKVRSGNHRIIYGVRGGTVIVFKVDDRKDVYRK